MIRIYTPESWVSIFRGYPELVIDDDGFIYSGTDYNKFGRVPIGKIDDAKGEVYGKDYNSMFSVPIGYIREDGGIKKVYSEPDSNRIFGAFPILYIKDGKVYTYEEYNSLFSTPSGYIKRDVAERRVQPEARSLDGNDKDSGGGNPFVILAVLFLTIVGILYWLYPTVLFSPSTLVGILLAAVGSVVAYKRSVKKWREAFVTILGVYTLGFVALFAVEALFPLITNDFKLSDLALLIVSPIPAVMTGILPSAIGAWIVVRIQKGKS